MRKSKEIREEAWALLWKNNHIWKLFGAGVLHFLIVLAVSALSYAALGKELGEGLGNLIGNLLQAVMCLGFAAAYLAIVKGEEGGVVSNAFSGYLYPFRAFFAQMVFGFVMLAWMLPVFGVIIVLGFFVPTEQLSPNEALCVLTLLYLMVLAIAIPVSYRYRQLWFIKAENPSGGAFAALKTSAKMMEGHKWELFKFDMSYWLAALWLFVPVIGWIVFFNYWALGSAIFYRDLIKEDVYA